MLATETFQPESVKILLEANADPNIVNAWGNIPLMRSLQSCYDGYQIVNMLIKAGSDIYHKNNYDVSVYNLISDTDYESEIREIIASYSK